MALNQTDFTYQVSSSDFKKVAARPGGVKEDAQIHPETRPGKFTLGKNGNAIVIKDVEINIGLVADDCWMLSNLSGNADLMKHEQGHYDIVAISARELYKGLLKLSANTTRDLQKKVDEFKDGIQKLVTAVDDRYDRQTDHSRKTKEQQQWNKAIEAEKQKPDGSLANLPL
jgi:hypothetical protein